MRGYLVGVVLLATVGCTQQQVSLQHASSLETRVRGVAILADGQNADVGMAGNTCRFDMGQSVIGADADVAQGEEDVVHDGFRDGSLVVGGGGVFIVDGPNYGGNTPVVPGGDITTSRFTEDGLATVRNNTAVTWSESGVDSASVSLPDGAIIENRGFTVDRMSGTAFAATSEGVFAITPDGAVALGGAGDLASFDSATGALYVATEGGSELVALEADGSPRWSVTVEGVITSMDDMGDGSAVAVMADVNGKGQLMVLDGLTGEIKMDQTTPSAAHGLVVGPTGRSMAVILENEVHFFNVNL